ncbi:MAG TPA: hypothetical protein VJI67_00065, partial [archaeon]|nr:hypothetical protein [archaeon]
AAPLERFEHGDKEVWIQEYAGISLLDLLNASPEAGREAIIDVARRVGDSIRKHSRFSSYRVVDAAENSRNPSLSNLAYNPLTGEVKAVDALLKRKTAWRFAKDVISDN